MAPRKDANNGCYTGEYDLRVGERSVVPLPTRLPDQFQRRIEENLPAGRGLGRLDRARSIATRYRAHQTKQAADAPAA
jgi:hypothetical protein